MKIRKQPAWYIPGSRPVRMPAKPWTRPSLETARDNFLIAEYIEDHNLDATLTFNEYGSIITDSNLIYTLCQMPVLVTLLALVMIVAAGGITANEFSQGTVKFLLINPVRRGKIL